MTVAETSAEAYRSLSPANYLQPKEQAVMQLFRREETQLTRERISQLLRWKESAVCGRVNSLVAKGALEEVDGGKTASGRSAKLVRLPRPEQRSLL